MGTHGRRVHDHMRDRGEMCATCQRFLPTPHTPGLKHCEECRPSRVKVLMCFDYSRFDEVWNVFFKVPPQPRPLPRTFLWRDADKIRDLYQRFGAHRQMEDRNAVEYAITSGQGIVELTLGQEQLATLQSRRPNGRIG